MELMRCSGSCMPSHFLMDQAMDMHDAKPMLFLHIWFCNCHVVMLGRAHPMKTRRWLLGRCTDVKTRDKRHTWHMHRCQDSGKQDSDTISILCFLQLFADAHLHQHQHVSQRPLSWYGVCLLAASRRIGRLLRFEGHQPFHPRHSPRSPDRLHGDTLGRRRWGLFRRWHPPLPFGNIVYRAGSRPRIAPCTRWLHGAAGKKRCSVRSISSFWTRR